jgi:hypothetical protein
MLDKRRRRRDSEMRKDEAGIQKSQMEGLNAAFADQSGNACLSPSCEEKHLRP